MKKRAAREQRERHQGGRERGSHIRIRIGMEVERAHTDSFPVGECDTHILHMHSDVLFTFMRTPTGTIHCEWGCEVKSPSCVCPAMLSLSPLSLSLVGCPLRSSLHRNDLSTLLLPHSRLLSIWSSRRRGSRMGWTHLLTLPHSTSAQRSGDGTAKESEWYAHSEDADT